MLSNVPPIWVVSLARATERREFAVHELEQHGLHYEIIDAVDGRTLDLRMSQAYSARRALFRYGKTLERGMIACSMSHLQLYRRMVHHGIPEVVVLEDDVTLSDGFGRVLEHRDRLPEDRDVVTLHSLFGWASPTPISRDVLVDGYRVCTYQRTPMGTQAYLITNSAARRALKVGYPVCLPPDELLFRRRPAGLTVYGIEPSPVSHDTFSSEIHEPLSTRARDEHQPALYSAIRLAGRVHRRLLGTWDAAAHGKPSSA